MKTCSRLTLLMPLLVVVSAPLVSEAATSDDTAASAPAQTSNESAPPLPPPPPPPPQDAVGLQTVVVNAERRTSEQQKLPAAISVRKGEDLLQQGKTSVRQVLEDIPAVVVIENQGMFIGGSDTAGNNVTIRGIKSNNTGAGSALSAVPTTALYTDGVYEGIGGRYDLDRVEVLRGPQGTLYGRSATSGVVSWYTRNPSFDQLSFDATAEFGSHKLRHYTGALNVPLSDTFALRIAADQFSRNGYDSAEGGAIETTSGRLKMLYKPNSKISVLFGAAVEQSETHTGGVQADLTAPNNFVYTPAPVRAGKNDFEQFWLNIDWDLGPATLTYLPARRSWNQDATIYQNGPGGGGLDQTLRTPSDVFMTHELRLASNDTGPLKWLLGGFHYNNRLHSINEIRWVSSNGLLNESNTYKETSNVGVFGEMTYALRNTWRLTAGLRQDKTEVSTTQEYTNNLNYACNTPIAMASNCLPGPPGLSTAGLPENRATLSLAGDAGKRKFNNTTYKLRVEHDLAKNNLLYAMVSTGFIPGDVQVSAGAGGAPAASEFAAEKLIAYEFGSKNRFLNHRLELNGNLFFYDYGGFHTAIRPDPTNPGSQILVTVPAEVWGAEIDLRYRLTKRDQLSLSYSYTDASFADVPLAFSQFMAEKKDVPGAVPHTFNAAYNRSFDLPGDSTLDFHASARYTSGYNLDNVNAELGQAGLAFVHVDNQWTGNLSGTWRPSNGAFAVTGYVRNVTDNRYKTFAQVQLLQPFVLASGTQNDPRTFGVVVSASF